MRLTVLCVVALFASSLFLRAEETAVVRAADGFQLPVGPNGTGEGYYIARGYRPNGHLGEDWNGVHGGDTDLGDPVYATAHGIVVFARNYHVGWGNVVILRHAYYEGSELKYVDSLYGHLLDFSVQEGEQVHRGQQIGRIGNNFGMYEAHLHFEMRKNIQIGMYRSSFARDFSNYYTPNEFVAGHRACPKGNHMVNVPINTFPAVPPPILAGPHVETPVFGPPPAGAPARFAKVSPLPPAPANPVPTPTPVFRTAKTSTPVPAATPEQASKKTINTAETAIAAAATLAATPTPLSKHSKKIATAATPEPKKSAGSGTVAATSPSTTTSAPTIKLSDDSDADTTPTVVTSATPAPASRHGKKIAASSPPGPSAEKPLTFQPVNDGPVVKTAETSSADNPVVVTASTPAPSSRHSKKLAAKPVPEPAPQKPAKVEELTADSIALPPLDPAPKPSQSAVASASDAAPASNPAPAPKHSKALAAASTAAPAFKKPEASLDLIPEPIAEAAPPPPSRKTRRTPPAELDATGSAKIATQVVAPQPILPAPAADAAPIRSAGSSFKVDRYEDLRGKGF